MSFWEDKGSVAADIGIFRFCEAKGAVFCSALRQNMRIKLA